MPAAFALGDFAAVIIAAFATLLAIGAYLIVKAIAALLPNIDVSFVHIHPGDWFGGIANHICDWIVDNTKDMWAEVGKLLHATAYIFSHFAGDTVNAIDHVFDYADHIVTVTIPRFADKAYSDAKTVADNLTDDIKTDVTRAQQTLEGIAAKDIRTLKDSLPVGITTVEHDVARAVASTVGKAEDYTDSGITDLRKFVTVQVAAAELAAKKEVADLKTLIGQQLSTLSDTVKANLDTAEQYAKAQASAAITTAEDFTKSADKTLQKGIDTAQAAANTAISTAATDLTTAETFATTTASTDLEKATTAATAAAGAAAAGAATDLYDALGGIYQDLTGKAAAAGGDLTSLEGLIAGAITAGVGALAVRVSKLEQCSVGVCDDSPNNFSNLLNDALGLAGVVGVGAFLAELVNDPAGAEQKYADVIGAAATGVIGAGGGIASELEQLLNL